LSVRPHDRTIFFYALLGGLPAVVVSMIWIWSPGHTADLEFALTVLVAASWLGFAEALRQRVVWPLQTMANLLMALREGDFSIRARGARRDDPLGEAMIEINALGALLQTQRRGAVEATALLYTVMEEIDVAIFAFDDAGALRLVNRAGQRLLAIPAERILGMSAAAVGLSECLEGEASRMLGATAFPGGRGRWGLRRTQFREGGRPHQLVVIADLSEPLRREELKAWQRRVRLLGHELNNSLAPIKSIAGSLGDSLRREPRPDEWEADLRAGLEIIASRAEGLTRFLQAYARLAKLPAPTPAPFDFAGSAQRAIAFEPRIQVRLLSSPPSTVVADAAQIEQVLINLVKNAADAVIEQRNAGRPDAGVRIAWKHADRFLEIRIEDDGPGVAQTGNLFVPFFTTKPEGSGIGLVLCRQIAENHGGSLELRNRTEATGCVALLRLPLR
jgi:nitrogen fixation/metabolism regulation signal transduction histidine kinase